MNTEFNTNKYALGYHNADEAHRIFNDAIENYANEFSNGQSANKEKVFKTVYSELRRIYAIDSNLAYDIYVEYMGEDF